MKTIGALFALALALPCCSELGFPPPDHEPVHMDIGQMERDQFDNPDMPVLKPEHGG